MAVDTNEIRRNNWLTNGIEPFQVTEVGDGTINLEYTEGGYSWIYDADECFGIPLSADLLLELGFEKDGFNNYNFFCHRNEFDYRAVVVDLNTGYIWFREGWKERNRIEDHLISLWNRDYDKDYYVHQLQNAVYALTGKEITYTNTSKQNKS
jgi:hypothetical protein